MKLLAAAVGAAFAAGIGAAASLGTLAPVDRWNAPLGTLLPARLPESRGTAYYVDGSVGRNGNRGTSRAPWKTIEHAVAKVQSGATIYVRGGTYSGEIEIRGRRFRSSKPVTIAAYPGEHPVFVGDARPALAGYPAIFLFADSGLRLRGLEVSNPNGDGIQVRNSSHVDLDHLFVHGNAAQGILVGGVTSGSLQSFSDDVQIWNSRFSANGTDEGYSAKGDHSIYYGDGSEDGQRHGAVAGVIANNLVYDQKTGRGIQVGQSAWGTIVANNTIYGTSSSNVYAGQAIEIWNAGASMFPTRDLVVVNNLLVMTTGQGVSGSCSIPMPTNVVDYNLTFLNRKGSFAQFDDACLLYTLGSHNQLDRDPRFVDPSRRDFRVQPGSPAVGAGNPAYTPVRDQAGRVRRTADLGAFASLAPLRRRPA